MQTWICTMTVHVYLFAPPSIMFSHTVWLYHCALSVDAQPCFRPCATYIDVNANMTVSASDFRSCNWIRVLAKWLRACLMTRLSLGPWGHREECKRTQFRRVHKHKRTHTHIHRYTSWAQRHTSRWPTLCVRLCVLHAIGCSHVSVKRRKVRVQNRVLKQDLLGKYEKLTFCQKTSHHLFMEERLKINVISRYSDKEMEMKRPKVIEKCWKYCVRIWKMRFVRF